MRVQGNVMWPTVKNWSPELDVGFKKHIKKKNLLIVFAAYKQICAKHVRCLCGRQTDRQTDSSNNVCWLRPCGGSPLSDPRCHTALALIQQRRPSGGCGAWPGGDPPPAAAQPTAQVSPLLADSRNILLLVSSDWASFSCPPLYFFPSFLSSLTLMVENRQVRLQWEPHQLPVRSKQVISPLLHCCIFSLHWSTYSSVNCGFKTGFSFFTPDR